MVYFSPKKLRQSLVGLGSFYELSEQRTQIELLGEWHHIYVRCKIPDKLGFLKGENLLDVGCGNGRYLYLFMTLKLFKFYVGLDVSRVSIYSANKKFKEKGFYADLVIGDAENLPFRSNIFEVVFSTDVIEHLLHPSLAIQEMVRVGKDKIIICTPNKLCPIDMSRVAQIFGSHIPPPIERYVTRFQLSKMIQNAGIKAKNMAIFQTSFIPLGWLLVHKKLRAPMKLLRFLIFIEEFLEEIPLLNHIAGVLVACFKK